MTAAGTVSSTACSPARLAARIGRGGTRIGADRRAVREPGSLGGRCLGNGAGAGRMHRGEGLRPGLVDYAHQIDHVVGALHGPVDRPADADIGLHGVDLAHVPERLQVAGKLRPAHGRPDPVAAPRQLPDDVPPQEAGPAEHGDEFRLLEDLGHGGLRRRPFRTPHSSAS